MQTRLQLSDRRLLQGAGVLALALIILSVLLTPPDAATPGYPSSYSPAPEGTKAAFLLMGEIAGSARRWQRPLAELPADPSGCLLILANPGEPILGSERDRVIAFAEKGGTVLLTGRDGLGLIDSETTGDPGGHVTDWQGLSPRLPSPLTRGIDEISMKVGLRADEDGNTVTLFGDDTGALALTRPTGGGRLIWLASPSPMTNEGLTRADNLKLVLNLVAAGQVTTVLWDEYYHGERGSLWSYLAGTAVPWLAAQGLITFAALAAVYSRRDGPALRQRRANRHSPLEFVDAVGDLHESVRAFSWPLRIMLTRLRLALARRLGVSSRTSVGALAEMADERIGRGGESLAKVVRESEAAIGDPGLDGPRALSLFRSLQSWCLKL